MLDHVPYGGWKEAFRLKNAEVELMISQEVGPRILSYRSAHGANVFHNYPDQIGGRHESKWMNRGGHRFWVAPEHPVHSYLPDNQPYPYHVIDEHTVRLTTPAAGQMRIRKELTVGLAREGTGVTLDHTLVNESALPQTVAPWALSVMAPGGLAILPQPLLGEHPRDLLPNRVVLWPYTDPTDPRFSQGRYFVTLRQDAALPPLKFGLAHRGKWAAYLLGDQLFIKTVAWNENAAYPDFGCNYESFTDEDMLEIETLGSLVELAPGQSTSHVENWSLFHNISPPPFEDSLAFADWLSPFLPR